MAEQTINFLPILLTGLIAGGLSCMAVQGGLLAATLAQREQERLKAQAKKGNAFPIIAFLSAKLISYTILGFFLGLLGSFFSLSISTQVILQLAVAVFMIGTALNLLNVHPIFRYFVLQPPKFLSRLVRRQSKSNDLFAPAFLGVFTIFIPCGTTQAMMALAVASGSPALGALVLFVFTLGTSPVFFTLAYLTTRLGTMLQSKFMKVAAFAIILLAVFNINNALSLSGSPVTLQSSLQKLYCIASFCESSFALGASQAVPVEEATITIVPGGYKPEKIVVSAGSKVTLHLQNINAAGCEQAFTIPKLNIQKIVRTGQSDTIEFIAPEEKGEFAFMCSMGMYGGTIEVI